MRQIILDTETTGLEPKQGHRIIEIGGIEMVDRRMTGNTFHHYINPEREIDEAAFEVHGISLESLQDKPIFNDLSKELLDFISGAELIIHNAPFDVAFLNNEFAIAGFGTGVVEQNCEVLDTLVMARHKHPGQKNSLDALCKRYQVDNSQRQLHGALLDAEILADVYLLMTGGQISLLGESEDLTRSGATRSGVTRSSSSGTGVEISTPDSAETHPSSATRAINTPLILASEKELESHQTWLALLEKEAPGNVVWQRIDADKG
ncbi:MAG: DNA polymerase III subunit epsilon [Gammaproteobacteria bacterium]